MILILVAGNADNPNQLVRSVAQQIEAAGEKYLIAPVPSLFLLFENSGHTQIRHYRGDIIEPDVIFHWVGGRHEYTTLDALDLAGYRLINPRKAWYIGRNKSMQLALFEREGIPHPWSLFAQEVSWARIEPHLAWDGRQYVLKPHDGGRGRDVHRARSNRRAATLYSQTPRYRRGGILIQEYLDHAPKIRHHFRVNVIGGRAVTGSELRAAGTNWITNEAHGGQSMSPDYAIEDVPEEAIRLAVRATGVIGADYSGVDVIEGGDGAFYVLETNEFPGFAGRTTPHLGKYIVEVARQQRSASDDTDTAEEPTVHRPYDEDDPDVPPAQDVTAEP